ncbi:unnamed protein product, partial [Prorocentrum cordatum]
GQQEDGARARARRAMARGAARRRGLAARAEAAAAVGGALLRAPPCCAASGALPAPGPTGASALERARALTAPAPSRTKRGEFEGHEFWEQHDALLAEAWSELRPRRPALYEFGPGFEGRYVHGDLREAAAAARRGAGEAAAWSLFDEVVPGVFASDRLFTDLFLSDLLEELEHIESSGIPRRRPNGMNRYGVILDQVGLEPCLQGLVAKYVRPLAGMLFPELITATDAEEHYAFSVRYEAGGDTELAKHGDAAVATLNLCLGRLGWTGGELEFFDYEASGIYALPRPASKGNVTFRPGMAVIHRGQHHHRALRLRSGMRTNVVVWLFARHGVVRVAPYAPGEQLSASQRWGQAAARGLEL